jgi:fucose permease
VAFTVLTESRGVSPGPAGVAVGVYWGSIGAGRVVFGLVADRIGIDRLLRYCLLAAGVGAMLFAVPRPAAAAFAGLVLAGIGLAPVFPCLMTRTPERLGTALSAHAIGFQVGAAMIGAAAVPGALGLIAGGSGLEAVPAATVVLAGVLWLLHEGLVRRPNGLGGHVTGRGSAC